MEEVIIQFNGESYILKYNEQSGYYEIDLKAPDTGGIYPIDISFTDQIGKIVSDTVNLQVLTKKKIELVQEKVFMWIFDWRDFAVKNIVEISDYEINIDEETNSNSIVNVLKKTTANANDIVAIKKNNEVIYWGIIDNIQNEDGKILYQYTLKYITNLFDQDIELEEEDLIKDTGVEDFVGNCINKNFISNEDTFINKEYLSLKINSHTKKQTSVTNVNSGIFNLHTWMTNCTQNYDIVYEFGVELVDEKYKLVITIENKTYKKELIDVKAHSISNYSEVFETDVISKVKVLTSTDSLTLFLLNDRTTTTDASDPNRAAGKITTVYTENYEDAMQTALDTMKANSYNHNITFKLYERLIKIGTPIAIKTKESLIFDTYISAIKFTKKNFVEYTCGNIRVKFIDKLLKERSK